MRANMIALLLALAVFPIQASFAGDFELIGDALTWYATWKRAVPGPLGPQTCTGNHQGSSYKLRCDPLSVAVSVAVEENGSCSVTYMGTPILGSADLNLDGFVARKPGMPMTESPSPLPKNESPKSLRTCGALPFGEGHFSIAVIPQEKRIDEVLSRHALQAALAYGAHWREDDCLIRSPAVRAGDPFAHVYIECRGARREIEEYVIRSGTVDDFPQWTYSAQRRHLPAGVDARLRRNDLWYATSRPEDRKRTQ